MTEAGCLGIVAGIIANIGIYIAMFGFEVSYLGPLWLLPGVVGGLSGGIAGSHLIRPSKWGGIVGGALGTAVAFVGMYLALWLL